MGTGPRNVKGSQKYGQAGPSKGLYTASSFSHLNIPKKLKEALADNANHSVCIQAWSSYSTAGKMFNTCADQLNLPTTYPVATDTILCFVAWLADKGTAAGTISGYLSGLRKIHSTKGIDAPNLRPDVVKDILQGLRHKEYFKMKKSIKRMPITPEILDLFALELKSSSLNTTDRLMMWAIATIAFYGCFRMGELLCSKSSTYDSLTDLCRKDIKIVKQGSTSCLAITLKHAKSFKGATELIHVWGTGGRHCPVRAYKKYKAKTSHLSPRLPAFTDLDSKPMTKSRFAKIMRGLLALSLGDIAKKFSCHSFRAGIPSLLANRGFSDDEIKTVGRWSSRAWKCYSKLPRVTRMRMAKKVRKF